MGTKDQPLETGNPREEENIPLGLDALDNLFKEKVRKEQRFLSCSTLFNPKKGGLRILMGRGVVQNWPPPMYDFWDLQM